MRESDKIYEPSREVIERECLKILKERNWRSEKDLTTDLVMNGLRVYESLSADECEYIHPANPNTNGLMITNE